MKTFVRLVVTLGLIAVLGTAALSANAQEGETKVIEVKESSLRDHGCDGSVWEFIINQVDPPKSAPASITVTWKNGVTEVVNKYKTSGGAIHYQTSSNLDSTIENAVTNIYTEWTGQFVLSHGPCGSEDTPTPTTVVTTSVPTTETPTETATVTKTPTETLTPTEPVTPTETETITITPSETPTGTITETPPTWTPTGTPEETITGTPVVTVTDIPPADPTPTEPSLGGEVPERANINIWPYILVFVAGAVIVLKKIL